LVKDRPSFRQQTACVAVVCRCITQCASGRVAWIAPWKVMPAGLIGQSEWPTIVPARSTFTRFEAETSE
jgi:hypothetical protein